MNFNFISPLFSPTSLIHPLTFYNGQLIQNNYLRITSLTQLQAQTPQQRRANERFAKNEAAKRGKGPITKPKQASKSPISAGWVVPVLLAFVVCGGLLLELLRVVPELWSTVASVFSRITG
ncbi:hypothetical protein VI817_006098 [Penicillium citrinum]|nr:hypothetical protein VI817_006098 [Penicillium citrinum]